LSAFEPLLAAPLSLLGGPVTWIELIGFALALAMVLANMKVWLAAWPLAIASSAAYGVLFAHSRLYGEATLQLFFIAVAAWGWWQWRYGTQDDGTALQVRALPARTALVIAALTLAAWPLLGWLLDAATDSDVPYWDALPTAGSVAGQWLLGRQYIANWPVWVVVNIASLALFAVKGLWLTVVLYALFAVLALIGWRVWVKRAAATA
jgi:nicotinamide mononucleotide transporter